MDWLIALVITITLFGYLALALMAAFFGLILWAVVLGVWDGRKGKQGRAVG